MLYWIKPHALHSTTPPCPRIPIPGGRYREGKNVIHLIIDFCGNHFVFIDRIARSGSRTPSNRTQ